MSQEKQLWTAPSLQVLGNIEDLTQKNKTVGTGDDVFLVINGINIPTENLS